MRRSGYAALRQWTLHNREHPFLLNAGRHGLVIHTLFYPGEVRALDEFRTETEWVTPEELELAQRLVESLATTFEPTKYRDHYRENLRALIDAKIRGEEVKLEQACPKPIVAPDILEALRASLARTKKPAEMGESQPALERGPKALAARPMRPSCTARFGQSPFRRFSR